MLMINVAPSPAGIKRECMLSRNGTAIGARFEAEWDRLVKVKLGAGGGSVVFLSWQCGYDGAGFSQSGTATPIRISLSALSALKHSGLATEAEMEGYRDGVAPGGASQAAAPPASDIELMFRAQMRG